MALYIPHSIFHVARLLYVRPETFGPYCVHLFPSETLWPVLGWPLPLPLVIYFFYLATRQYKTSWKFVQRITSCYRQTDRLADRQTDRFSEANTLSFLKKPTVFTYYSFISVVVVRWDSHYRRIVYQVLMTTSDQYLWNDSVEGKDRGPLPLKKLVTVPHHPVEMPRTAMGLPPPPCFWAERPATNRLNYDKTIGPLDHWTTGPCQRLWLYLRTLWHGRNTLYQPVTCSVY